MTVEQRIRELVERELRYFDLPVYHEDERQITQRDIHLIVRRVVEALKEEGR